MGDFWCNEPELSVFLGMKNTGKTEEEKAEHPPSTLLQVFAFPKATLGLPPIFHVFKTIQNVFQRLKKLAIKALELFRHHRSFAQDGEDMVLRSFFEQKPKGYRGFYVDVGAHHPVRFSTTLYFYRQGWRGINIDATPGSMRLFGWFRRQDLNLELGIGSENGALIFYCFDEPALNTLSKTVAAERVSHGRYKIKKEVSVPILPLREVLDKHLPAGQHIDFLSVDVEGMDEVVLRSNDWIRFRPKFVLAEDANFQFKAHHDAPTDGVFQFLSEQGYSLVAKTQRTLIFKDTTA